MTINRILHARSSSSMDFYDTSYFTTYSIDPTKLPGGKVFGYGWEGPNRVVVDLVQHAFNYPMWDWTTFEIEGEYDTVDYPVIPPSLVRVDMFDTKKDQEWKNYYLGFYNDCTPNMFSVATHKNIFVHPDGGDLVYTFNRHVVDVKATVPICNGFFCFPNASIEGVRATGAVEYFNDPEDRQRQSVLLDFSPVGGATFVPMSSCKGSINMIELPDDLDFNEHLQSVFVVVDGRLLLDTDISISGNKFIRIKPDVLTPVLELDRQVCIGTTILTNKRIVSTDGSRDLFNAPNSFLIIVESPLHQLVKHEMWFPTSESTMQIGGNSSYYAMDKLTFDLYARGLLYERNTKAVHDYAREEHTSTFYAGLTDEKIDWKVSTVTIVPERPLVILRGTEDNLMSAKAMMFDKPTECYGDDTVLWPKYVILDFIFRR